MIHVGSGNDNGGYLPPNLPFHLVWSPPGIHLGCWENYDKPADGFAVLHNVQRNPCPNIEKPMVGNYIHMFSNIGHFPMSFWRLSMGTRLRRSQGRCCPPRCEDQPCGKVLRTWLRLTHDAMAMAQVGPPTGNISWPTWFLSKLT